MEACFTTMPRNRQNTRELSKPSLFPLFPCLLGMVVKRASTRLRGRGFGTQRRKVAEYAKAIEHMVSLGSTGKSVSGEGEIDQAAENGKGELPALPDSTHGCCQHTQSLRKMGPRPPLHVCGSVFYHHAK